MQRKCVCGKYLAGKRHLCDECSDIYGQREEWPEWLKFWVNDTERENRREINIDEHEISFSDLEYDEDDDYEYEEDGDNEDVTDSLYPFDHLIGCRTETHLYEDRSKHPPSNGLTNSYNKT